MATTDDIDVQVVDNPEEQRYEGYVDGALAGFVEYGDEAGQLVLEHTEVEPSFEGRGVGSRLAAGVLDDIRRRGVRVGVRCPFVRRFVMQHPEYRDLVVPTP